MSVSQRLEVTEKPRQVDLRHVDVGARRRLIGPAFRTFLNIANEWRLTESQRLRILGSPNRSTFYGWRDRALRGEGLALSLDTLLRISALLGVYKGLFIIMPGEGDGLRWLQSPNSGSLFGGQPPFDLLTNGGQDGLLLVRRYLDAWRGGAFSLPGAEEAEMAPLNDDDLVVV